MTVDTVELCVRIDRDLCDDAARDTSYTLTGLTPGIDGHGYVKPHSGESPEVIGSPDRDEIF